MNVQLDLAGLRHDTGYEAYVDVGLCTADPASAGRHSENFPPSGGYAANEFSFDFETNSAGSASALAQRYWGIGKRQRAKSVVIQRRGTGRTAACVTVPFKRLNPGW
jgi:hypothetical protein